MYLRIIYARDSFGIVGVNGGLPWSSHDELDMATFKNYTSKDNCRAVVCGYNTALTLPESAIKRMPLIVVPVNITLERDYRVWDELKSRHLQPIPRAGLVDYIDNHTMVIGGMGLINSIFQTEGSKIHKVELIRTTRVSELNYSNSQNTIITDAVLNVELDKFNPESYRLLNATPDLLIEKLVFVK